MNTFILFVIEYMANLSFYHGDNLQSFKDEGRGAVYTHSQCENFDIIVAPRVVMDRNRIILVVS